MIKGKLFPLHNLNISDNDYAAAVAYKSTHFTSSTLMKLTQAYSVKANLSDIAIILSQTTFSFIRSDHLYLFLHFQLTDSYLSLFCTVVLCVKFHKVVAPARASVLCRPVDF